MNVKPEVIAEKTAASFMTSVRLTGEDGTFAEALRRVVHACVMQAFGCTCYHPGWQGDHTIPVYIEDVTCPVHGTVSLDELIAGTRAEDPDS